MQSIAIFIFATSVLLQMWFHGLLFELNMHLNHLHWIGPLKQQCTAQLQGKAVIPFLDLRDMYALAL